MAESKAEKLHSVRDVAASMDAWAPQAWAYDWDAVGLQAGDPDATVTRVLTCLTPSRTALEAAKNAGAEMVVAHHPLIFKPLRNLRCDQPVARLALDFHTAGIAVFSAHTNLDVAPRGVSHVLAERLGLEHTKPLFPAGHAGMVKLVVFTPEGDLPGLRQALSDAGAGIIGNYTQCSHSVMGEGTFFADERTNPQAGEVGKLNFEPERRFETLVSRARLPRVMRVLREVHPYEEPAFDILPCENIDNNLGLGVRGNLPGEGMALQDFARHVALALDSPCLRVIAASKRRVKKVAVLGGSGGGDIARIPFDVDCFVTGDVKYHDADLARDRGLNVLDAGHVPTELPIVPAMAHYLEEQCAGISAIPFLEDDPFSRLEN